MNNYAYLNYIEDLFFHTATLYSWHLSPEYAFTYSNHPVSAPLKNIFMLSLCSDYMKKHFSTSDSPIFLYDDFFFLWAAIPAFTAQHQLISIHLLGPVFSSYTSDSYIKENMDIQNMSIKSKKELLNLIQQVPIIPTAFLGHYVCQLYYTLNDRSISSSDIKLQENISMQKRKEKKQFATSSHSPYFYEKLLLKSIEDGIPIPNISAQLASAQIGVMCPGDPIRQKKDEAISLITIFTRTAIQSNVSAEKAYTSSDYYIQSIEAAHTISEIIQLVETLYLDITSQVHEASVSSIRTPFLRDCITYLDSHYKEKIDLEQLANTLGYTKYYLSMCFKKELGISISEYLTNKKISYAKTLLQNPYLDMREISDELNFSNPSHFSSVFRKVEGITPSQYRKQLIHKDNAFPTGAVKIK